MIKREDVIKQREAKQNRTIQEALDLAITEYKDALKQDKHLQLKILGLKQVLNGAYEDELTEKGVQNLIDMYREEIATMMYNIYCKKAKSLVRDKDLDTLEKMLENNTAKAIEILKDVVK